MSARFATCTLLVLAFSAYASEYENVAVEIQKAWRDHAIERIQRIATESRASAWLVVHEVLVRGDQSAAKEFARHHPDPGTRSALLRYVSLRHTSSRDDTRRLRRAKDARLRGSARQSLETLSSLTPRRSVLGVLVEEERARACRDLNLPRASRTHLLNAAEHAHVIGWAARRDALLRYAVDEATRGPSRWHLASSSYWTRLERSVGERECVVVYESVNQRLVGVVVRRGNSRFIPLGSLDRIVGPCAELSSTRGVVGARTVRRLIVDPLGLRSSIKRIIVVPTKELRRVPFAVLEPDRQVVFAPKRYPVAKIDEDPAVGILAVQDRLRERGTVRRPTTVIRLDGPESLEMLQAQTTRKWRAIHFECTYEMGTDMLGAHLTVERFLAMGPKAALLVVASSNSARMRLESGYVLFDGAKEDLMDALGEASDSEKLKKLDRLAERLQQRIDKWGIAPLYLLDENHPRILVSLWEVDEAATRELMGRFYGVWDPSEGIEANEALLRAQSHVRSQERWALPLHWAGWQLWGNVEVTDSR